MDHQEKSKSFHEIDVKGTNDLLIGVASSLGPNKQELADKRTPQATNNVPEEKPDRDFDEICDLLNKCTSRSLSDLIIKIRKLNEYKFNQRQLQVFVNLVFENVTTTLPQNMAKVCTKLSKFKVPDDTANSSEEHATFTTLVLNKCQNQFDDIVDDRVQKLERELAQCADPAEEVKLQLMLQEENKSVQVRFVQRMTFMGELFKESMIPFYIMVYCMEFLIEHVEEERLQCLCKMLKTFGKDIEREVRKPDYSLWEQQFDDIFKKMQAIVNNKANKINKNVRSMLQDVLDLKKSKWVPKQSSFLREEQSSLRGSYGGYRRQNLNNSFMNSDKTKYRENLALQNSYVLETNITKKVQSLYHKLKTELTNQKQLQGLIDLLYNKAAKEPKFSTSCAKLFHEFSTIKVPADDAKTPDRSVNIRALIINKCQEQFEIEKVDDSVLKFEIELAECTDTDKKKELQLILDEEKRRVRMMSVANIRLIGELFKLKMLTIKIIDYCMKKLIDEENETKLECLCELMLIAGEQMENENKRNTYFKSVQLDNTFKYLQDIVDSEDKISHDVKYIRNVIELRQRKWVATISDSQSRWNHERIHKKKEVEEEQCMTELIAIISVYVSGCKENNE